MNVFRTYFIFRKESYIFLLTIALLSGVNSRIFAQEPHKDTLFTLDAQLVTSDSLLPIPDADIISKRKLWGNISNKDGRFKMDVDPNDTLMISSIGFSTLIYIINDSIRNIEPPVIITMNKDTILINEVVIHAFWDYETFKQKIIDMPSLNLDQFYPNMDENPLDYIQPAPYSIIHPIQSLYNMFNRSARLQRKLIRNRKEYNEIMIQMGRINDTIPAIPEHMQGKQH